MHKNKFGTRVIIDLSCIAIKALYCRLNEEKEEFILRRLFIKLTLTLVVLLQKNKTEMSSVDHNVYISTLYEILLCRSVSTGNL